MSKFKVLKEYKTLYVRSFRSNYEIRAKIVLKPGFNIPDLLLTKVYTKDFVQYETSKLGRIPASILDKLSSILIDAKDYINAYIEENL